MKLARSILFCNSSLRTELGYVLGKRQNKTFCTPLYITVDPCTQTGFTKPTVAVLLEA